MMDFYIFDRTDTLLWVRNDAESAVNVEEEYRLTAVFPLTAQKIESGMRIGFYDQSGGMQVFEVRQVKETEPDEAQEVECEHIAVAELLDEIVTDSRPTSTTAALALVSLLSGTEWEVGTAVSTSSASMRAYYTSVWEAICTLRDTWGVRIKPRITLSATGISGRYIDIVSSAPVNRGVRLEINKNIEQIGVTYDDRFVKTALIGRGKGLSTLAGDETTAAKLTFEDEVWTTPTNPANKPSGQAWVEDTAATALYGRNGRKRMGYIEFSDITDAGELLTSTWNYLQTINSPRVTVDCSLLDLFAYGYDHEQILLGDEVNIVVDPLGVELQATVIKMERDLLRPENTRPTIGNYRAGIDYMTRENSAAASTVEKIQASNPDLINGVINTMVTAILSTGTKRYTDPTDGADVYETSDGTKAVKITGAGLVLASSKVAGVWQWRTAITGTGIVADEITTGTLLATLITILGDSNMYWTGANLYVVDPTDSNKQIRIGKYDGTHYGIGFTSNGGSTWGIAIDFTGAKLSATDEGRVASLELDVSGLQTDVSNAEGDISTLQTSVGSISSTVSTHTGQISTLNTSVSGISAVVSLKSTVYVQTTQPTGTTGNPLKSGDTWFDSDDAYKAYTYNGSSWQLGAVAGLLSSYIDIRNDIIQVFSGGQVSIQTDTYQIKNAAGNNMMKITAADSGTGEPGGRMELGEEGYPVKFGGNFVLAPGQGGTGYTSGQIHRSTSPSPSSSLGSNGDVVIYHSGDATGYSNITPSVGSTTSTTYFGKNRSWNHVPVSGYVDAGNLGTGSTYYGAYWSFSTPSGGLSSLTLQMTALKYLSGTWYGWNNGLPLTVSVFSGTGSSTVLGTNTFVPPNNAALLTVPIVFSTPLTGSTTYYIAVYDPTATTNKTRCLIQLSTVLIPGVSGGKTYGLYVKSSGAYVDLFAEVKKVYCGTATASSAGVSINYSAAGFTSVPYVVSSYSQEASAWSGDQGILKVCSKTKTGASIQIGGSFTSRLVDWIAIGT